MNVLSLCDGIGCGLLALDLANIKVTNYLAIELDKYPRMIADHNLGHRIVRPCHDVFELDLEALPKIDLVMFGFPCQDFSVAGNQTGDARLLERCIYILRYCQTLNPNLKFIIENVKMKKSLLEEVSKIIGVEPILINSSLLSAQKRERYYWANFIIPQPFPIEITVTDILEKYELGDIVYNSSSSGRGNGRVERRSYKAEKAQTVTATGYSNRSRTWVETKEGPRELNTRELARLQTIPDWFQFIGSDRQARRAIGNGWTVKVIAHILSSISKN